MRVSGEDRRCGSRSCHREVPLGVVVQNIWEKWGIRGVSTVGSVDFITHGTFPNLPAAASRDTKGEKGSDRYDGVNTPLAGHDLTDTCHPQTLVWMHWEASVLLTGTETRWRWVFC